MFNRILNVFKPPAQPAPLQGMSLDAIIGFVEHAKQSAIAELKRLLAAADTALDAAHYAYQTARAERDALAAKLEALSK